MAMGSDAMTKFEWEMVSGAKLAFDCVINVTTPGGGDTAALMRWNLKWSAMASQLLLRRNRRNQRDKED